MPKISTKLTRGHPPVEALNAGEVAEYWRLMMRSVVILAQSQVYHTERPPCLQHVCRDAMCRTGLIHVTNNCGCIFHGVLVGSYVTTTEHERHTLGCLWEVLPNVGRALLANQTWLTVKNGAVCLWVACSCSYHILSLAGSPLPPSRTTSLFHSRLKIYLLHTSLPAWTLVWPQDWLHGLHDNTVSSEQLVFVSSFLHYSFFVVGSMQLTKLATHRLLGILKYSLLYHIVSYLLWCRASGSGVGDCGPWAADGGRE